MGESKYLIVWHDETTESKVAADLLPFFEAMIKEVTRHYPKQGDSWKTCDIKWLETLAVKSIEQIYHSGGIFTGKLKYKNNPDHLIDIADFLAFIWIRRSTQDCADLRRSE